MRRQLLVFLIGPLAALGLLGCDRAPPPAASDAKAIQLTAVAPTGPSAVGRTVFAESGAGPEVRAWYPAVKTGGAAEPSPAGDRRQALARRFGDAAAEALVSAPGQAVRDAPAQGDRLPIVLLVPGANMGGADYRLIGEDLASHGYAVIALSPLGSPPADKTRWREAAAEIVATVARLDALNAAQGPLHGRLDPGRIAVVGHSIGGAAAVLALRDAPAIDAVVNLDGDYAFDADVPAPDRPILYLIGVTPGEAAASTARRAQAWARVSSTAPRAVGLQVADLRHFDFTDAALAPPADLKPEARRLFGPLGGERAHAITVTLVHGFLDEQLKGEAGAFAAARASVPEAAAWPGADRPTPPSRNGR